MRRLLYILMSIFVLASLVFMGFLWSENEREKQRFVHESVEQIETLFSSLLLAKRQQIDTVHKSHLSKDEITRILLHVKEAKIQRELLFFKTQLHEDLFPLYQTLHTFGAIELNIFLENSKYFLQMHQDTQSKDVSSLVSYVNKYRQSLEGVTMEQSSPRWHYVYPLFYEKEYVGGVEVVFDLKDVIAPMGYSLGMDVLLEKADATDKGRDTQFVRQAQNHVLLYSITLDEPVSLQGMSKIIFTRTTDVFMKYQQHLIVTAVLLGLACIFLIIVSLSLKGLSKKHQSLSDECVKRREDIGRLQRILMSYESFLSLMPYWRKPLDGVMTSLLNVSKKQGNNEELVQSVRSLQRVSEILDDFAFAYDSEREPQRIIPLFEAVWQIKKLYEASLKQEGIDLVIENGTKTLVSIKLVNMVQAIVSGVLFVKEMMATQKKIPGRIRLHIFNENKAVCVAIEGEGVSLHVDENRSRQAVDMHKGLHLAEVIIVREHGGMMDFVQEEEREYLKISLPSIKEVSKET